VYGNKGPKKEYTPDPAMAYVNKSKSTGETYLKVIIREDIPAGTELVMFKNNNKKAENHPDYHLKFAAPKKGGAGGFSSGPRKAAPTQNTPKPQQESSGDDEGGLPF
jgi:hypothetical protein